jgi:hypothetical protein
VLPPTVPGQDPAVFVDQNWIEYTQRLIDRASLAICRFECVRELLAND